MYERSPNCSGKLGEHYGNIRLSITENVYESFQRNWLLAYEGLLQILGDVDDEVAHALQRVQYVYVVDACLVIIRVVIGVIYLGIAEVVAQVVDAVLGIVGVGYLHQWYPCGRPAVFLSWHRRHCPRHPPCVGVS